MDSAKDRPLKTWPRRFLPLWATLYAVEAERDALQAHVAVLREALERAANWVEQAGGDDHPAAEQARTALSSTPSASLERLRWPEAIGRKFFG